MNEELDKFKAASKALFQFLVEHDLVGVFCELMKSRAECAARDTLETNDANIVFTLKGQISICYELVDGAREALAAKRASANDPEANGPLLFGQMQT